MSRTRYLTAREAASELGVSVKTSWFKDSTENSDLRNGRAPSTTSAISVPMPIPFSMRAAPMGSIVSGQMYRGAPTVAATGMTKGFSGPATVTIQFEGTKPWISRQAERSRSGRAQRYPPLMKSASAFSYDQLPCSATSSSTNATSTFPSPMAHSSLASRAPVGLGWKSTVTFG